MKTTILRSRDLSCPTCIAKIEKTLSTVPGVSAASVHFSTGRIEIWHDPQKVTGAELAEKIRQAGYEAKVAAF